MKKFRPVCLILVLCLVLAMLPVSAMAVSDDHSSHTTYDSDCDVCLDAIRAIHASHADMACIPCKVKALIGELPNEEEINVGNAAAVTEKIHAIDRIKFELTDPEYYALIDIDVHKYHNAVKKIGQLDGGGWLVVTKIAENAVGNSISPAELTGMTVKFTLDGNEEGSVKNQPLTLSTLGPSQSILRADAPDLLTSPLMWYTAETNGWTYRYRLPAGEYTLTENTDLPPENVTWSVGNTSGTGKGKVARFSIEDEKDTIVLFINELTSTPTIRFLVPDVQYNAVQGNSNQDCITVTEGTQFTITALLDESQNINENYHYEWSWISASAREIIANVNDTVEGNPVTIKANMAMDGQILECKVTGEDIKEATKQIRFSIQKKPAAGDGADNPAGSSSSGSSVPKTGDGTPLALLACMTVLSLTGLYFIKRRSA